MTIKKKSEIQKLHLNFKIRLKPKSIFEIYVLFLKKLKIDEKIRFSKGNLDDLTNQISTRAKRKISEKSENKIHFSIFVETQNSDLKFVI